MTKPAFVRYRFVSR